MNPSVDQCHCSYAISNDRGSNGEPTASFASQRALIEGNVTSSHRQNSKDSDAGYPDSGCGDDGKNDGCGGRLTGGKAMAAKPSSSCKTPSKPARRPTGRAQRAHDLHRISCHVMPFPPHSCMNRYQSGNSGPAANMGRSKEYSANHVVRGPGHHEVVNAKTQRKDERG